MTLSVVIFLNPPSSCGCCGSQTDNTLVRSDAFVKSLKSRYGEEVDIKIMPLGSRELDDYPAISELKTRKNLKPPVVLVNNVIRSIGRYPSEDELEKWKP